MTNLRSTGRFVGFGLLAMLPSLGSADTFVLRRDNVIPVVFEQKLTVMDNRPGDLFKVRVTDNGQLPRGAELEGQIDRIHPARGRKPASMDLRFVQILLPDHSRVPLDAAPLALDDKYITRTGDGRMVAKQDVRQQQNDILGGAIGGFIVGSILHRRITGTIIGTMIGISAAESDRAKDSNVVVNEGDRVGALINRDVTIDFAETPSRTGVVDRLDRGMNAPARDFSGRNGISISFQSKQIDFPSDARPFWIGRTAMIPLEIVAKQMSLDVDRRPDRTVYVDSKDKNIRLTINSRTARLEGKRYDLPRTVLEQNGVLYVPLEAVAPLLKDDIFLNGTKFVIE